MKFKQIIPAALAAVILGGCTPAADTSVGIEQTAAVTTEMEEIVTTAETKPMKVTGDGTKYLANGYSLEEIGYELVIPEGKMPTDPLFAANGMGADGKYIGQIYNFNYSKKKEVDNFGYRYATGNTECSFPMFFDKAALDILSLTTNYYVAFKRSDFEFGEEEKDEKAAFGGKLFRYNDNDYPSKSSTKFMTYEELKKYQICILDDYIICDLSDLLICDGFEYEYWLKNIYQPNFLRNYLGADYDYSWILNFRKYMSENFEDCVKKID
ncbi:MAG: hypothetical protein RR540_05640 [Oscillospiraceae bacterium]